MSDTLSALRNAAAAAERSMTEGEVQRQAQEPPPEQIAGKQYVAMVETIKRLAVEYDDIEKPNAFTMERYEKLRADAKQVGRAIYSLGGTYLMRLTLELYVSKQGGMHGRFSTAFDGIGGWLC